MRRQALTGKPFVWGRGPTTLFDMLRFNGKALVKLVGMLAKLDTIDVVSRALRAPDEPIGERLAEILLRVLRDHAGALDLPGFALSKMEADNLRKLLAEGTSATNHFVAYSAMALRHRIEDELSLTMVWQIPPAMAGFFEPNLFGPDVAEHFPSAILDLEDAGKCLGMGRTTACVFHLMRVMEIGLRVLAATLKDARLDPKRNPSWDSVLKKCREELGKPLAQRAPEWAANDAFFSGATGTLMAVKDAWRNPTMHVEISYDEERALDVWNCVKAFMRHLATNLHE